MCVPKSPSSRGYSYTKKIKTKNKIGVLVLAKTIKLSYIQHSQIFIAKTLLKMLRFLDNLAHLISSCSFIIILVISFLFTLSFLCHHLPRNSYLISSFYTTTGKRVKRRKMEMMTTTRHWTTFWSEL
jgi:hypothetical protein